MKAMKKIVLALLVVSMLAAFTGCSRNDDNANDNTDNTTNNGTDTNGTNDVVTPDNPVNPDNMDATPDDTTNQDDGCRSRNTNEYRPAGRFVESLSRRLNC